MKQKPFCTLTCQLAILSLLSTAAIKATPYATELSSNGGVVSFRLNQNTATNDTVLIISSGGTVTNAVQLPSADESNFLPSGIFQTNLTLADGPFKVYIKHTGTGVISPNSPTVSFNSPRGIAVNSRPGSPYFGWVYVANSAAGAEGDGMFAFTSDLSDAVGQGTAAKTAGFDFGSGGGSSPYHASVAPDDSVLVTDWSDANGNVIAMDPELNTFEYVLKPLVGTAAAPVGADNNHGSLSAAVITGTGADRVLYTMDEDYQTDPTSGVATEWNSVWRYDIGDSAFPYTNAPARKIMMPYLTSFDGQNQQIDVAGHYLYANQRRSNFPQHSAYVVDLDNLMDPSTFNGTTPWGAIWTSQDASLAAGYSDDVLRDTMAIAVSPDDKWFAAIIANVGGPFIGPDGNSIENQPNDIILMPLTNGIPNIAAMQRFHQGGDLYGRDVAFDAAHNLYFASSGLGYVRSLDIGESTEAITGSDGTFTLLTPATQVSVAASTSPALEEGSSAGVITVTRTPEEISQPLTVFYTISGSATNGVDYETITNQVIIPANETSADITITPIDDNEVEPVEKVVVTVQGSGGYSVGFPLSATVFVEDNETPQLQILSLSTNIYEGNLNDYATLKLRRLGRTDVDVTLDASSFAFGGTAVSNVDYYLTNLPVIIPAGTVDYSVNLIYPLAASTDIGSKSIILTNLEGAGYTVTNNTATSWLTLKAITPGTVLFSDDFESQGSSANWNIAFATTPGSPADYAALFGYDYAAGGAGNLLPIPAAPNSTNGDTHGLYLTVNKADEVGAAAALNLYLKDKSFSGNYAVRFDMYLVQNSAGSSQSKNEMAMFGINHSGALTNWIRNSVPGTGTGENQYESDGLFATVEADAGTTVNYGFWSGPTYVNGAGVAGPTNFLARRSSTLTQVFKKPPFDAGPAAGGVPANTVINPTPTWVQVELSQIGDTVTWKINNTEIFSYVNTNENTSAFTEGTVMLGYDDPWDDIANGSAGSGEACVIYDNLRVVALETAATTPTITTDLSGTTLSLIFPTETGHNYVVEWKNDLTSPTWNTLETDAGTGSPITASDDTQSDAHRFYRVRVE
jgi:hypothetical protein